MVYWGYCIKYVWHLLYEYCHNIKWTYVVTLEEAHPHDEEVVHDWVSAHADHLVDTQHHTNTAQTQTGEVDGDANHYLGVYNIQRQNWNPPKVSHQIVFDPFQKAEVIC